MRKKSEAISEDIAETREIVYSRGGGLFSVLKRYAGKIFPLMPQLIGKIDFQDWDAILNAFYRKKNSDKSDKATDLFVSNLLDFVLKQKNSQIKYCLGEIRKTQRTSERTAQKNKEVMDLEGIILNSVNRNLQEVGGENLSALHDIFLRVHNLQVAPDVYNPKYLAQLTEAVKKVPDELRQDVINGAKAITNMIPLTNSHEFAPASLFETQLSIFSAYAESVVKNAASLGKNIPVWVKRAMGTRTDPKEIADYFKDTHGYFTGDLSTAVGGLPLSDIHGRLANYVKALTGRNIKIKDSQSLELKCLVEDDSFMFPTAVNISSDEEDNYGIYKALASYQSGALMFQTYKVDSSKLSATAKRKMKDGITGFFDSFDDPELARVVFNLLEFSRIDSKLQKNFPGLVKDLQQMKIMMQSKVKTGNGFRNFTEAVFTGERDENLEQKVYDTIQGLRDEGAESVDSFNAVPEAYKWVRKNVADSFRPPKEVVIAPLEEIAEKGEDVENTFLVAKLESPAVGKKFRYNEWDSLANSYKEGFVQVIETAYPDVINNNYVAKLMETDAEKLNQLKQRFEMLVPEDIEKVRRQLSGEFDFNELVRMRAEIASGITPSEKVYTRTYKSRRSVASLVLSEDSGSLRRFTDIDNPGTRVIDLIKQAQVYFAEAIESTEDRYALAMLSGETEKNVEFYMIKDFNERYGPTVRQRIGSVRPLKQNRDGAGIRHGTSILKAQPERIKLLFYLMEGVPHDMGYEGEYAAEDTRVALSESRQAGCVPIVLAFGPNIDDNVRRISENCIYREIDSAEKVPEVLPTLYRRIAF